MFLEEKESKETLIANGLGGIGGKALKLTALGMVHMLFKYLTNKVEIVGCGGIYSAKDVLDFVVCGATAVQIGTSFLCEGESVFGKIQDDLETYMKQHKITCLDEIRGRVTCTKSIYAKSSKL